MYLYNYLDTLQPIWKKNASPNSSKKNWPDDVTARWLHCFPTTDSWWNQTPTHEAHVMVQGLRILLVYKTPWIHLNTIYICISNHKWMISTISPRIPQVIHHQNPVACRLVTNLSTAQQRQTIAERSRKWRLSPGGGLSWGPHDSNKYCLYYVYIYILFLLFINQLTLW